MYITLKLPGMVIKVNKVSLSKDFTPNTTSSKRHIMGFLNFLGYDFWSRSFY